MSNDIFLHPWVQSSKKAGGISLRAFFIALAREGGLTFTSTCPEDDLCYTAPAFSPRALKGGVKAPEFTAEQVQEGFTMMLNVIADQNRRIDALTALVNANAPIDPTNPEDLQV